MKLAVVPELASRRAAIAAALVVLGAAPPRPLSATQADKVDTETGKLVLNNPPTIDVKAAPPKVTSHCFLDVVIGDSPPSRLEIDLCWLCYEHGQKPTYIWTNSPTLIKMVRALPHRCTAATPCCFRVNGSHGESVKGQTAKATPYPDGLCNLIQLAVSADLAALRAH